jgi:signal transduction histidine kinase
MAEFFQRILELCLDRLDASAGTIRLLDEAAQRLVVHAQLGPTGKDALKEIGVDEGISGRAVREKRLIYIPDVLEEEEEYLPYLKGMRSEMVMPFLVGETVLGVFNVEDPRPNAFDAYKRELFEVVVSQTASHIRDKIELEKETAKRIATELDAKMGRLARAIAHHVRSKTGLIRADAQDLLDDMPETLPTSAQSGLANVVRTADSIVKLVADLFRPYELREKEIVPVDRLLGDAVKDLPKYDDIEITWTPNPGLPMIQIETANAVTYFEEIIINAVKAIRRSGKGGKIAIKSQSGSDGFVEILFSNNGPPIPENLWETIFEEFVVGPESAKEPGVHGLGLWGARVFFERQGGTVRIIRSDEEGTTFTVRLPPTAHQEGDMA